MHRELIDEYLDRVNYIPDLISKAHRPQYSGVSTLLSCLALHENMFYLYCCLSV